MAVLSEKRTEPYQQYGVRSITGETGEMGQEQQWASGFATWQIGAVRESMKVIMVVATSKDGFIASEDYPHPDMWTSPEDKEHLRNIVSKHSLLVFGKNTYDVYGKMHSKGTLRIVLTRTPEDYAADAIPGELEFMSITPEELVAKYKDSYGSCLLLGGAYVYESYLDAGLVDEIYQTVEPVTFNKGKKILSSGKNLNEALNLPEPTTTKLNDKGTTLRHYILKK